MGLLQKGPCPPKRAFFVLSSLWGDVATSEKREDQTLVSSFLVHQVNSDGRDIAPFVMVF